MTDLDKQARELLAAEHRRRGSHLHADRIIADTTARENSALAAIRAALLSAPPGWKLVPVEPTSAMIDDGCLALAGSIGGYEAGLVRACWAVMLAAAKEVGNG